MTNFLLSKYPRIYIFIHVRARWTDEQSEIVLGHGDLLTKFGTFIFHSGQITAALWTDGRSNKVSYSGDVFVEKNIQIQNSILNC